MDYILQNDVSQLTNYVFFENMLWSVSTQLEGALMDSTRFGITVVSVGSLDKDGNVLVKVRSNHPLTDRGAQAISSKIHQRGAVDGTARYTKGPKGEIRVFRFKVLAEAWRKFEKGAEHGAEVIAERVTMYYEPFTRNQLRPYVADRVPYAKLPGGSHFAGMTQRTTLRRPNSRVGRGDFR